MHRHIHIFSVFIQAVSLNMAVAVVGIPFIYATHTHVHDENRCDGHHHSENPYDSSGGKQCNICEFYAHFVPKEADSLPAFTFQIPVIPICPQFGCPACKRLSDGLLPGYTNKGPPSSLDRILTA